MSDKWHYSKGSQRLGPVTEEEIRRLATGGQLQATDFVWKKGMGQWAKANTIEGLLPSAARSPRPDREGCRWRCSARRPPRS